MIVVGSGGTFWLYKLKPIVLAWFDTWYVVGTLLDHIPDHEKLCVMGFHRDQNDVFLTFWHV